MVKIPKFVPIVTAVAARVSGHARADLFTSASRLGRGLLTTQKLVGNDGVLCVFEPSLLPAACRQRGGDAEAIPRVSPMSDLLEAVRALRHGLPPSVLVLSTFAAPAELGRALARETPYPGTEFVCDVVLAMVRASFDAGADGVLLVEQVDAGIDEYLACYRSCRRLAEFYQGTYSVFHSGPIPGSQDALAAHCVFTVPDGSSPTQLISGRLDPALGNLPAPVITAGDLPSNTPVELLRSWAANPQIVGADAAG